MGGVGMTYRVFAETGIGIPLTAVFESREAAARFAAMALSKGMKVRMEARHGKEDEDDERD